MNKVPSQVFYLPFTTRLTSRKIQILTKHLKLTTTRTDDIDDQVAFTLIGKTGALRLFQGVLDEHYFHASADSPQDKEALAHIFPMCVKAIHTIQGHLCTTVVPPISHKVSNK